MKKKKSKANLFFIASIFQDIFAAFFSSLFPFRICLNAWIFKRWERCRASWEENMRRGIRKEGKKIGAIEKMWYEILNCIGVIFLFLSLSLTLTHSLTPSPSLYLSHVMCVFFLFIFLLLLLLESLLWKLTTTENEL